MTRHNHLAIAFGLCVPLAYFGVHGGMNTVFILLSLASIFALWRRSGQQQHAPAMDVQAWLGVGALALPLLAALGGELVHRQWQPNALDSPSRFLLAVPVFLWLRRHPDWAESGLRSAITVGGLAAGAMLFVVGKDYGAGRMGSTFLNYIHYGDLAAMFGVGAAVLALERGAPPWLRTLCLLSALAGFDASLRTQTRSSWMSAALLFVLWALLRPGYARYKLLGIGAIAAATIALLSLNPTAQQRARDIGSDLGAFAQGHKDTDLGIRLQLWHTAGRLIAQRPLTGWGAHGFKNQMDPAEREGLVTPLAAAFGRGETHNQLLHDAVNYGLPGLLGGLGLFLIPGAALWRRRRRHPADTMALLGLLWVAGFVLFGLTVETYDLSMTAAIYALAAAAFMAVAAATPQPDGARA